MRLVRPAPAELGAGLLAAGLLATGLAWPGWTTHHVERMTRLAADAVLEQVAEQEQLVRATHGRFVSFGPMAAERKAALPGLSLGAAAALFDIDGLLDENGVLHLQVVSNLEAIRSGHVTPLIRQVQLGRRP